MKKRIIPFEKFEADAMQKTLELENSINRALREQYKASQVIKRDFTGAGFFTYLNIPEHIPAVIEHVEYGYGDVWASINNSEVLFGFVLFVENGKMTCFEGYMCADEWPKEIYCYQMYHHDEVKAKGLG